MKTVDAELNYTANQLYYADQIAVARRVLGDNHPAVIEINLMHCTSMESEGHVDNGALYSHLLCLIKLDSQAVADDEINQLKAVEVL